MVKKEDIPIIFTVFFLMILWAFFLWRGNFLEIKNSDTNNATSTIISSAVIISGNNNSSTAASAPTSTKEEVLPELNPTEEDILTREAALKKADNAKGIYINGYIASSFGSAAQENIKKFLSETELNAIVIDVKESAGPYMPASMKKFIEELHKENIWVIARICVFRDSSLIKEKPEWYLKQISTSTSATGTIAVGATDNGASSTALKLWKDAGGGYWLDPESPEVQDYIIKFSQKAVDFGFDELQFDYIRFPSDGDTKKIVYPYHDGQKTKSEVMKNFFTKLSLSSKAYKYSTVLSVDLFGYVATQYQAPEIGQKVADAAGNFDFISFMLYPSHFYAGFSAPQDSTRQLPAVYFPYQAATDTSSVVSSHPYEVVFRSVLVASDYLLKLKSETKIRPWLQDFDINPDTDRGIYYDTKKVKDQIQAAEDAGSSGWLLWNPLNIYTKEALLPEKEE
jgi:hypothetical protein